MILKKRKREKKKERELERKEKHTKSCTKTVRILNVKEELKEEGRRAPQPGHVPSKLLNEIPRE